MPRVLLTKTKSGLLVPPSRLQTLRVRSRDQDSHSHPPSPSPEGLNDGPSALKPETRTRTPNAETGKRYRRLRGKGLVNSAPAPLTAVATSRSARSNETAHGRATISPCQRRRRQLSADFPSCPEVHSQRTGRGVQTRRPFAATNGKGVVPRQCWVGRDIVWEESDHGGGRLQDDEGGAKANVEKGSAFCPAIGTPAELQDTPWTPTSVIAREVGSKDGLEVWRFVRPLCGRQCFRWIEADVASHQNQGG